MKPLPASVAGTLHRWYKKAEQREHRLLYLFIELTRLCNLTCRHCGSDCSSGPEEVSSLSTNEWCSLFESVDASFSPAPTLVLTGGEPIIHPDFETVIRTIDQLGLHWGLVTNGYALTERVMRILEENHCLSITVSVDGLKDDHDWLRGRAGVFDRTTRALDLIAASRIPLRDAVTCVNPRNQERLDAIARFLLSHSMPAWRLFRIFPAGRAHADDELLLSADDTRRMIDWVREKRPILSKEGIAVQLSCEGWLPFAVDRQVRDHPFFCRAGVNIASVLHDGTVTGCSNNDPRFHVGNIRSEPLDELWEKKFGLFRDRSWVKKTSCGSCRYVGSCEGGSIHLWRNDLRKPDFCYAARL